MIHLNQDVREPGSLVRKGLLLLWATAVGCAIVGSPAVGVAQSADLSKGLLGHWRFEEDVSDSSANGKNGVATGDPVFVKGKIGKAIKLDGRSQFVSHRFLLGDAAEDHLVAHGSLAAQAVGGFVLAFSRLEPYHRDVLLLGVLLQPPDEAFGDLS